MESKYRGIIPPIIKDSTGVYHLERIDEYPEPNGRPYIVKPRYRNRQTGKKQIRQLHYNAENRLVYGLPKGRRLPLFNSPALLENISTGVALGEGESVALSPVMQGLREWGILSSCTCGKVKHADLSLIEYRSDLWYFMDADEPGVRAGIEIKKVLPWIKILPLLEFQTMGDKSDLADFPELDPADLLFWMDQEDGLEIKELEFMIKGGKKWDDYGQKFQS